MNAVERLVSAFEDMVGESDTELGREALSEHSQSLANNQKLECAYCGWVSEVGDEQACFEHVFSCEKRPEKVFMDTAVEIESALCEKIIHLTVERYNPDNCHVCSEIRNVLQAYKRKDNGG